jgi:hypothetical protein
MQQINSDTDLRGAIILLENRQDEEEKLLKKEFHGVYESIKPINIIINTLKEATGSLELKENFLITTVGITAGYISQKLFIGSSHNPLKKIIGAAIFFGITNLVAKHPEAVKSTGRVALNLVGRLLGARPQSTENDQTDEIEDMPRY